MTQKGGFFVDSGSVASGSSWRPTVPAGEIWWTTNIEIISGGGGNAVIIPSSVTGLNYSLFGPASPSEAMASTIANHVGKPIMPWTPTTGAGPMLYASGASGRLVAFGVCLDAATEGFSVLVPTAFSNAGVAGTVVPLSGQLPAGKAWLVIVSSIANGNRIRLKDYGANYTTSFLEGGNVDPVVTRSGKSIWMFSDSPFQGLDAYMTGTNIIYASVMILEFSNPASLDEYQNRWSVNALAAANSNYDIRPPVGESWSVDVFDATGGAWYFVDGVGTETLLVNGIDLAAGLPARLRAYYKPMLTNDWYLRFKPGAAAQTIRVQGIKDKL